MTAGKGPSGNGREVRAMGGLASRNRANNVVNVQHPRNGRHGNVGTKLILARVITHAPGPWS